ncbi:peptide deformylase [Saccharopolyspora sp. NPDC000995]
MVFRTIRRLGDPALRMATEPITVLGSGLMARCLQHETDHLDGVVYIQRLDSEHRRDAYRQVREQDWCWQ